MCPSNLENTKFFDHPTYKPEKNTKKMIFISPFFYFILSIVVKEKKLNEKGSFLFEGDFKKYLEKISISPFSNFVGLEDTKYDQIKQNFGIKNNPKTFAEACRASKGKFLAKMRTSVNNLIMSLENDLPEEEDVESFLKCLFSLKKFEMVAEKILLVKEEIIPIELQLLNWQINHPITQDAWRDLR